MTLKPPDWADLGEPKYDVWVRIEIMKACYATADILAARYGMTSTQEEVMDRMLVWYMETGKPQNLTGLSQITGRSHYLVNRDVNRLIELGGIIAKGKQLYPSPYVVIGSVTSTGVVESMMAAARNIEQMLEEKKENSKKHHERMRALDKKLDHLFILLDGQKKP